MLTQFENVKSGGKTGDLIRFKHFSLLYTCINTACSTNPIRLYHSIFTILKFYFS